MKKIFFFLFWFMFSTIGWTTPPEAKEIFQLSTTIKGPNTLLLHWNIKPGYFLYKEKINLTPSDEEHISIGYLPFPKPEIKTFRDDKRYEVYRKELQLSVSLLGSHPGESYIEVRYQGCADDGFCYPPEKKRIKLSFNAMSELSHATIEPEAQPVPPQEETPDAFTALFSTDNLVLILFSFLGFGLLLSFTPCVLPMVPVLSGLIVGHGKDLTTRKAFFLSLSYVLSMSFTYAIAGAVVALMGSNLQAAMQSPWVISAFSLIFVLLALSMFGYYELRLPLSWQNKLAGITRSHAGGHYLGSALMGCLSTLIISPCVTAPLIGALGYIAHTGNVVLGSVALFALGLGMGLPLLLVGLSAGKLLPKAGNWMNEVKSFFGVILLAMAIYLMERILPSILTMALWGSLLIFCGIYLGALTRSMSKIQKFNQGLGIICLVYGILILIGVSQGNSNPLQPLATECQASSPTQKNQWPVVKSLPEAQQAIHKAQGKPIVLDFYADWCSACKVIARTTLKDPHIIQTLQNFVVIKADVTANDAHSKALLNHFNVVAPPTFLFFDANGNEISKLRAFGDISAEELEKKLDATLSQ